MEINDVEELTVKLVVKGAISLMRTEPGEYETGWIAAEKVVEGLEPSDVLALAEELPELYTYRVYDQDIFLGDVRDGRIELTPLAVLRQNLVDLIADQIEELG